jgi:hypothetical protein
MTRFDATRPAPNVRFWTRTGTDREKKGVHMSEAKWIKIGRAVVAALTLGSILAAAPAEAQRATPVINTSKRIPFSCFLNERSGQYPANCSRADLVGTAGERFSTVPAGYAWIATDVEYYGTGGTVSVDVTYTPAGGGAVQLLLNNNTSGNSLSSSGMLIAAPSGASLRIGISVGSVNFAFVHVSGYLIKNEDVGL